MARLDSEILQRNACVIRRAIAAMMGLVAVSFAATGLTIDPWSNPALLAACPIYLATSWLYRTKRPDERLHRALQAAAQLILVLLLGILLSYAAVAVGLPYRDAELHALDQWLGLDRRAYLDFVNGMPWFARTSQLAYLSIQPQTALIPFALIMSGQIVRLQQLVMALALSLLVTVAISVFFPALAAFVYLDLTPAAYANIGDTVYTHVPTLEALRSGAMRVIQLNQLEGLLTFPSFHTASAVLYAWAMWRVPYLRWIALALNLGMLIATPVDGAHYFVDVAAGLAVAVIAIMAARRLCKEGRPGPQPAFPQPIVEPASGRSFAP